MRKILFVVMLAMSCFVFWDFFVRDNPQMTDVEGNNFTRIVKGLVELIIGVACMLTAFVLWDIDEGMNA